MHPDRCGPGMSARSGAGRKLGWREVGHPAKTARPHRRCRRPFGPGFPRRAGPLPDREQCLYLPGRILLAAIATAAVILAVVTVPHGAIGRLLSLEPLPWLGRISYGMYLWHFPLFVFLSPGRTGLTGLPLFVARLVATVALSAVSFYVVERPILEGTFWRSARARSQPGPVWRRSP